MQPWLVLVLTGCVGFSAGCGSGDDDASSAMIDCATDTTTYEDVAMFDKCVTCHASELIGGRARHQAPANINFDTFDMARALGKSAVPTVKAGMMPPPNSGIAVSAAERQKFYAWVQCGLKP